MSTSQNFLCLQNFHESVTFSQPTSLGRWCNSNALDFIQKIYGSNLAELLVISTDIIVVFSFVELGKCPEIGHDRLIIGGYRK
jgi:hypothetical protein